MAGRRIITIILFFAMTVGCVLAQNRAEWQDETIVSVGKEPPRSYFMSYNQRLHTAENDFTASAYFLSLNNVWRFKYYDDYRNRPGDFYAPEFNDREWKVVPVPGNWEVNGIEERTYLSSLYEFQPKQPQPPALPEATPVGLYRTYVQIPVLWLDRDIYLHIGGAVGGLYIYVNGEKVGYSEDSKSAAEFNISKYVTDGINVIAMEIYRYSTGSYLEGHDAWRLGGVERDIYIYSQPKMRIEDYYVNPTLDANYTDGIMELDMCLINNFNTTADSLQIWFELEDARGVIIDYSYVEKKLAPNSRDTVRFREVIKNVNRWSAEDPYLYNLVMRIRRAGRFTEYISQKIGFRTVEIKKNQYLINGRPVYIKGVTYSSFHQENGHVVDEETLREDMKLMKQFNINAIKLNGHPEQRLFYELASEYGFYVCNEANIESAGSSYDRRRGGTLGNNPRWLNAHMDRVQSMYHQTKNYPAVTFWSLGRRAGNGYNHYHTYNWLKSVDKHRPVIYHMAEQEWNTDVIAATHPTLDEVREWSRVKSNRPVIFLEYAQSSGNSVGNLKEIWDLIYNSPHMQGGFIHSWVDMAFLEYDENGDSFWAYGGDYSNKLPSDGSYSCKGLVGPDRTPHPATVEVKKAYQGVHFEAVDLQAGKFLVKNLYDFTNTNKFEIRYTIKANHQTVASAAVPLSLSAGESKEISVPMGKVKPMAGVEYFVNFSVTMKEERGVLKKGFEVASEQFLLPVTVEKERYAARGTLSSSVGREYIAISSGSFAMSIDKQSGFITSYNVNGVELMEEEFGLRPNFWRAPTDNDHINGLAYEMKDWYAASRQFRVSSVKVVSEKGSEIEVEATYSLPEGCGLRVVYKVYASGIVNVSYKLKGGSSAENFIPRLGMRMRLPGDMTSLEYFGRGPEENYSDRSWGTDVGHYKSDVSVEATDYIRPQETGHHTDTRWLVLTRGSRGVGLLVEADNIMEFNALNHAREDYDSKEYNKPYQQHAYPVVVGSGSQDKAMQWIIPKQVHINDLPERSFVEVSLDYKMMGVGGDGSWGAKPETEHMINVSEDVVWGFTLIPVRNAGEALKVVGKRY